MSDEQPIPPTLPGKKAGMPHWLQLLILIGGGFVLMFGGCLIALERADQNDTPFFIACLSVGGVMFMTGLIYAVFLFIRAILRAFLKKK